MSETGGAQGGLDLVAWDGDRLLHTGEPSQRVHREMHLNVAFAGMPDA